MNDTTREDDIDQAILERIGKIHLKVSKFVSVITDGDPAMVGKGAITVLQSHTASLGFSNTPIKLQGIIYQEISAL